MDQKKRITKAILEAKFMVKPEDVDKVMPKLKDDDIVKLMDEEVEITEDEHDRASRAIEYGSEDGEITDRDWEELHNSLREEDGNVNPKKLRVDVAKFMDKLDLSQFEHVIAKIDKPIEQAEVIAAFAEKIGVPRAKLPSIISTLRNVSESVNPIISKKDLITFVESKTK